MRSDPSTDTLHRHPNGALDLDHYIRRAHRQRSVSLVARVRARAGFLARFRPTSPQPDR